MVTVYEVEQLSRRFAGRSRPANDDISFHVEQGEIFGLIGANGAGKTTLIRQMVNLLPSSSGTVRLYGQPLGNDSLQVPLVVGYMPQQGEALNHMTVDEALYFTAHLRGLNGSEARKERDGLVNLWGLGHLRDKDSATLSGGERRLLRLAVAMAGHPPVLVLDEPTNDLDPERRRMVWQNLRSLNQEEGTTILFVTHDTIEAERIIQRVGIMIGGRLAAVGRPADLKRRLNRELKIDLRLSQGVPVIEGAARCEQRGEGHWIIVAPWNKALELLTSLPHENLDDIRVQLPTLEDIYLDLVDQPLVDD